MLAEAHGWSDDPLVAIAHAVRGLARLWRGRLDEAQERIALAERGIHAERYPPAAVMLLARARAARVCPRPVRRIHRRVPRS